MKFVKLSFALIFTLLIAACSAQENLDIDVQIQQAMLALPTEFREGAMVLGYINNSDELSVIRKGNNAMICLADNPQKEDFNVAGYHKNLEPYMERGRVLKREGKSFQEIFDMREKEVASGKIKIPSGSILYVVSGKYNEQGQPTNLYQRFVVYIPYATTESTGLALSPSYPGGPWIMNPGTHRAHIMINPTVVGEKK
jgi:hypothetical protein